MKATTWASPLTSAPLTLIDTPHALFAGVSLVLAYLIVPPLIVLVQSSFWVATSATQGSVSAANYAAIVQSPDLLPLVRNSLVYAFGSSVVGITLGGLLAWLVERTNVPFKGLAYLSAFVTLAVPEVIKAIGWVFVLGPRNGIVNAWLMDLTHSSEAPFDLFTMPGMIVVSGLMWAPAVFLLLAVPFRSMDMALEEAAGASGASAWQTFRRVTLPLARPAVLSLLLLTFVRLIESFEVPAIIGLPGRVYVLTTEIYLQITTGTFPDYGTASAYAVLLILLVSVGISLYGRATREAPRFATITGKGFRPRVLDLGRGRYLAGLIVLFLPSALLLPILLLAWASLQPFYARPSIAALSRLTFEHYSGTFLNTNVQQSIGNSLAVAVASASIAVLLTVLAAWLIVRTHIRGRFTLDFLISFTLVFPGIVLGLAIVRTYVGLPLPVYGTLWILVIAYVTRFLPYAIRFTYPGLLQIHPELEEGAVISGAGLLRVFASILLPLLRPAVFGAWVWVFLIAIRELSVSVLLVSPRSQVIATTIYALWAEGQLGEMAAYSVAVTVAFSAFALVMRRVSQRWGVQV
jgi:iron(III) transport system permease protein